AIVGTVGLLIPLTCTFAGIGVIVDRAGGARRELLAAPIPRSLIVLGNMAVAIAISVLQITALILAGPPRGRPLPTRRAHPSPSPPLSRPRHRGPVGPAVPVASPVRRNRVDRRPAGRAPPRAARRPHSAQPDRARQHGRGHRDQRAADHRADPGGLAARQPL